MKKSTVDCYPQGSAEYVVMHARWQASRGRRPSATLSFMRNPRQALAWARRYAYFPDTETGLYLNGQVPEDYKCGECGAHGVKLWRLYQTFLDHQQFTCAECSAKAEDKDISGINADGCMPCELGCGDTDQIGWRVPAIPTEELDTYWGYSSVPQPGCDWWRKLPNTTKKAAVA